MTAIELPEPHHSRLSTMLLCASMIGLGVAIGTNALVAHMHDVLAPATWSAAGLQEAESYYQQLTWAAMAVFGIGSVGVVALEAVCNPPETEDDHE